MQVPFNSIESGRKRVRNWLARQSQMCDRGDTRQAPTECLPGQPLSNCREGKTRKGSKMAGWVARKGWLLCQHATLMSDTNKHAQRSVTPWAVWASAASSIIDATGKVPRLDGRHSSTCCETAAVGHKGCISDNRPDGASAHIGPQTRQVKELEQPLATNLPANCVCMCAADWIEHSWGLRDSSGHKESTETDSNKINN